MKISQIACISLVTTCIAVLPTQAQTPVDGQATLPLIGNLVNSGFEAGLSGWTMFTTANGSLGPSATADDRQCEDQSESCVPGGGLRGRPAVSNAGSRGGRRRVSVVSDAGREHHDLGRRGGAPQLSRLRRLRMPDSTRFWLIIDGQIVSRLDLGEISNGQLPPHLCPYRDCSSFLPGTASAVLSGSARVGAGPHYVMIAITRVYPSALAIPRAPPSISSSTTSR